MDQASLFSDTIAKSSSMLGGLLSQMNKTLGGGSAQNQLFSSLVDQGSALQTTLAAQTPVASSATVSSTASSSTASGATSSASSDSLDSNNASGSSDVVLNRLNDISTTLHKIMQMLHQKSANASTGQGNNRSAKDTLKSSAPSSTAPAPTSNAAASQAASATSTTGASATSNSAAKATAADTATAATSIPTTAGASSTTDTQSTDAADSTAQTDSTSDVQQTVTALIAELLSMTQMVIHNLETKKTDTTGTQSTAAASPLGSLAGAVDANMQAAQGSTSGTASTTAGTIDLANALDATQADLAADPLLQLLKGMEKTVEKLVDAGKAGATTAPVTAGSTADVATQVATLETNLKQAVSAIQNQLQSTLPVQKILSDAAQSGAAASAALLTKSSGPEVSTSKASVNPNASMTASSFTAMAAAVPAPPVAPSLATNASIAQDSSAALVSAANAHNVESDADSDDSASGKGQGAAQGTSSLGSGLNAGNAGATGTYNFASTLSAIRATSGGTVGLPTVTDQVILQMNRSVKNGNDQMSLQLHPAELGKITVKLDFGSDGKVQGTVTADNPTTLDMLQKDSRSLERALQDAGLRADPGSLQFSLNQNRSS